MKKLLAVCLVFVLVGTLLCGCGGATVDLGDGPSVSQEEAISVSEKDGKITGRLDLDRYSFAQLSEAEKEENVLSFDGDMIVFDGSYKGNVTLEGNGHKSKSSAEFQTNNSEPIRFTLTADYGAQDRYVVFIAGGHGSEGSDSDTTEPVTPASLGMYVTFNGERYPTYATIEEALANPSFLQIDANKKTTKLSCECSMITEDYPRVEVNLSQLGGFLFYDEYTRQSDYIDVKNFCAEIRYMPPRWWVNLDNYVIEYVAFIFTSGEVESNLTESANEPSDDPSGDLLFNGVAYPAYSSLEEAEANPIPLEAGKQLRVELKYTRFSTIKRVNIKLSGIDGHSNVFLSTSDPYCCYSSDFFKSCRGKCVTFTVKYAPRDQNADSILRYYVFDVQ